MIIYKTINLINGKVYVGQDSNNNPNYLGSGILLYNAINKYGKENFKKEIIEFCNTRKELNEREIFWIKKLDSRDRNIGYNISEGGTIGDQFTFHPDKENIRKRQQIAKKNLMKPVYQYDLNGIFIKKFDSINQAANECETKAGEISRCCNGNYKKHKGYIWRFEYYENHNDVKNSGISCRDSIPVLQYDLNGNFIKEHNSLMEAYRVTHVNQGSISHCCVGEIKKAGGFVWKYCDVV